LLNVTLETASPVKYVFTLLAPSEVTVAIAAADDAEVSIGTEVLAPVLSFKYIPSLSDKY